MIRPVRIAEIERAVCEVTPLQRMPHWIGQIRTGFQYNGDIRSSGDIETETIGSHTEAGIAGLE
jgi:hypothetical protein